MTSFEDEQNSWRVNLIHIGNKFQKCTIPVLKREFLKYIEFEIRKRRSKDSDVDGFVDPDPDPYNAEQHEPVDVAEREREDNDDLFDVFHRTPPPHNHNVNVFVHDRGGVVHDDDATEDNIGYKNTGILVKFCMRMLIELVSFISTTLTFSLI